MGECIGLATALLPFIPKTLKGLIDPKIARLYIQWHHSKLGQN